MNNEIYLRTKQKWDTLAKPIDGLGAFEDIICRIAAISGDEELNCMDRSALVIMCADNGVVDEGISQTTQDVTASVAKKMGKGESSACRMAAYSGTDTFVYDIGMICDEEYEGVDATYKVGYGTRDIFLEPAMSEDELRACLQAGERIVKDLKDKGYGLLALGEMGIGNTTTSACVSAGLLKLKAKDVTGPGAGLSPEGLKRKIEVVDGVIERHGLYELTPEEILRSAGGYDIAALTGICLGAHKYDMPVILDGFITETAACAAVRMDKNVKDVLIASHSGNEKGAKCIEEELGLRPVIYASLKLGEGTGAVMLINMLRQVMTVFKGGYSFADIKLDQYKRY